MRCEAIDCLHNADGYCADESYVEIDHTGECTQFEYATNTATLCTATCPENPSFTDYGKTLFCPIDRAEHKFGTECPHLSDGRRLSEDACIK